MPRQRRNVGPSQGPTIIDVAERAGVSVSTVSRVLNGRTDVAAATRSTIERSIADLGFAPRVTAQRLAVRRSHTVSLLFPVDDASTGNHDLDFVLGAAAATSGRSYFFNLTTEPVDPPGLRGMFRSGLVEGVILMQVTAQDWRVALLEDEGLPAVLLGRTESATTLSWVDFDFESAVASLYDYLVSIGHRHVGFVGLPRRLHETGVGAAVRLQHAHEQAVVRHGLAAAAVPADLDPVSAGQAALHLLDSRPELTALVATHGPSTMGIIRALAGRGLRVPHDVSVATVAAPRVADLAMPALTCVPFPSAELGFHAASVLVRALDDRAAGIPPRAEHVLLPATVSVRETTAPPRPPTTEEGVP